ncbi:MAG: GDSL-type esterase/lipase family protein [Mobilitalea sp.]
MVRLSDEHTYITIWRCFKMNKWITANAFAQRELAAAISPNVAGCTVKVTVKFGLSGSGLKLVFEEAYGKQTAQYLSVTGQVGGKTFDFLFDGKTAFSVAPGRRVKSDPVALPVAAGEKVTLYIAVGDTQSMSETSLEQQHSAHGNFSQGDFAAVEYHNPLPGAPFNERLCGLKEILVETANESNSIAIAAFGDSITESAVWVNPLNERITAIRLDTALLNLGIGGNRLLRDTNVPAMMGINAFGKSGIARLDDDVFGLNGVKAVIFALGANDIAQPGGPMGFSPPPQELCTFEELRDGIRKVVSSCREKGLAVIGTTLSPFKGYPSFNEKSGKIRNDINEWIKTCGIYDYVIDFASLFCAPGDSDMLNPEYNIGDGLHPNPMGGAKAVAAIDVEEMLRAIGVI